MRKQSRLALYRDTLGFDRSTNEPFSSTYRIRCSQCESLVINGHPSHERGCPHDTRKCPGIHWVGECTSGGRVKRGEHLCATCEADLQLEMQQECHGEYA